MKWRTPILPYLAVGLGIFWFRNAWIALIGFHMAILVAVLVARSRVPIQILFMSSDARWLLLSVLLCGSSGVSLHLLRPYFGITSDLSSQVETLGLTKSAWPSFIGYFVLVNPFVEEYYWRGVLGNTTSRLYSSDFLYAGFHALIMIGKIQISAIVCSLIVLVIAGWFWRQIGREDKGLLAAVLGHMAADLTILLAVYQMAS
jgi:hypothetical protein